MFFWQDKDISGGVFNPMVAPPKRLDEISSSTSVIIDRLTTVADEVDNTGCPIPPSQVEQPKSPVNPKDVLVSRVDELVNVVISDVYANNTLCHY